MKFELIQLHLQFKQSLETIRFKHFNYIHGGITTGKSSIAQLVDYCLGGNIKLTPALQSELVHASLHLEIESHPLHLQRTQDSDDILAEWIEEGRAYTVKLPSRTALDTEVIPNTGIKVLSDLLYHLAGIPAPRVKNKANKESGMARLSFRDLWEYCYLIQKHIDSDFFSLAMDEKIDANRRHKARSALKFILKQHAEQAELLGAMLDKTNKLIKEKRLTVESTKTVLSTLGIKSTADLKKQLGTLDGKIKKASEAIAKNKTRIYPTTDHEVDLLKEQARSIQKELDHLQENIRDLQLLLQQDERQKNELLTLQNKFKRDTSARGVLGALQYTHCPKCTQALPHREEPLCQVCGQPDLPQHPSDKNHQAAEADLKDRLLELDAMITGQRQEITDLQKDLKLARREKQFLDSRINQALEKYDSAYLSQALELERELARLERQRFDLDRLSTLPALIETRKNEIDLLKLDASRMREDIQELKAQMEADAQNLKRFMELFLDCLVRCKLPNVAETDQIEFDAKTLYPRISSAGNPDVVSTFTSIASGGKMTLFKCCFALALHRVAARIDSPLPEILVIDTPSKNMSPDEDHEQYEAFHDLLYQLAAGELRSTQFIFIDNDFRAPKDDSFAEEDIMTRYLSNTDPQHPPLIPYYRGQ
ncbi:hypothetical protein [Deinococcus roseus]|uniref:Rad50/SbcC-type AAA domain-containing protein n=1 Tax=Deinococcus roseus TaxID=392414 RepID=A0ABQ2DF67_9DEIO|nr:hypothetical protein [Deinococcus roseus]GGJ55927.1 hypothetical protein GCM10008938_47620 [Deinococcus roseus]